MNRILALLALVAFQVGTSCAAQPSSPRAEREAILEAARPIAERLAGQPVRLRMDVFNIDSDWALIFGRLVSPSGGDLDWSKAKGCAADDDKSLTVVARKVKGDWTIKDMDICAVEPGYWHVDQMEKIGLPCDLYRGIDVPSGVNPLQPLEQCKGYREKRLVPPGQEASTPCGELATALLRSKHATPVIDRSSIEQLMTWRASRCETPPEGAGNVVMLCQARTKDGGSLFYWRKRAGDRLVDGSLACH